MRSPARRPSPTEPSDSSRPTADLRFTTTTAFVHSAQARGTRHRALTEKRKRQEGAAFRLLPRVHRKDELAECVPPLSLRDGATFLLAPYRAGRMPARELRVEDEIPLKITPVARSGLVKDEEYAQLFDAET